MQDNNRPYQDDTDANDTKQDPLMNELNDDPTEELQVPPDEFEDEMDSLEQDDDDTRETIKDHDEDDDNPASSP